ncbi:MAG: hypothetical protein K0S65_4501 [Labilithrix sp.]|nr:hypothetical protein [Labilithrix sp.]
MIDSDDLKMSASDDAFLDEGIRALRGELPDDVRMRGLEQRLGPVFDVETTPPWWRRRRFQAIVGVAVVIVGVAAGGRQTGQSPASLSHDVMPVEPSPAATSLAPIANEPASAVPTVSVDSLPSAQPSGVRGAIHPSKPVPTSPPPAASASESSGDELALLEEARRALGADPAKALTLTDEHTQRFRTPSFAEERERLAIDALGRLGRRDEAARRATAFEAAYPGSAHLQRIRALVAR